MPDYANGSRSFVEGLTFNNAAEIEAALRAAARLDPSQYRRMRADLEAKYGRWAQQNPGSALGGELAGAVLPGVVSAFVPGGQPAAATVLGRVAGTLPRLGRVLAEPVTAAAARFAPSVEAIGTRFFPRVLPVADEVLTGALQSIGSADTLEDVPRSIVEDAPQNIAAALGVRALNEKIARALAARRQKKGNRR